jgi:hypothetical protein
VDTDTERGTAFTLISRLRHSYHRSQLKIIKMLVSRICPSA